MRLSMLSRLLVNTPSKLTELNLTCLGWPPTLPGICTGGGLFLVYRINIAFCSIFSSGEISYNINIKLLSHRGRAVQVAFLSLLFDNRVFDADCCQQVILTLDKEVHIAFIYRKTMRFYSNWQRYVALLSVFEYA